MSQAIKVNVKDLPIRILVSDDDGQTKPYVMVASGKKFGACLQAPQAG